MEKSGRGRAAGDVQIGGGRAGDGSPQDDGSGIGVMSAIAFKTAIISESCNVYKMALTRPEVECLDVGREMEVCPNCIYMSEFHINF